MANWPTAGATGAAKGLVGRWRRVAARAGFITTSTRLHHDRNLPADRPPADSSGPPRCRRTAEPAGNIAWREFVGTPPPQPDHGSPTTRNTRSAARADVSVATPR